MADGSLVIDTELDNEGFEKGSDKLLSALNGLSKQINALGGNMQKSFVAVIATLQNMNTATQQSTSSVQSQAQAAAQAASQTAQAQTATAAATNKAAQATSTYDKELAKLHKQIDAANNKLAAYYDSIEEIHASTDEMLALSETQDQVERVLEMEQIQLDALNKKYADKIEVLRQLEAEYERVAAARDAANNAAQQEATKTGGADSAAAIQKVAQAEKEASKSSQELGGSLKTVDRELKEKPGDAGAAGNALNRLSSIMSTVKSVAIGAGKGLLQLGFRGIAAGAKRAVSRLKSFRAESAKTVLTSNALVKSLTSVKRLLITRVKRMLISAVFEQAKEGLEVLKKYSDAFKNAVNNIKRSTTELSGNVAVALGNILVTIEPIITKIIDLISRAVQWLNQFFALLGGKKTYTVAKQSAAGAADETEKAAKAQKEWNNELYSFDELNKQSEKNKDSGGDSGGGAGVEYEEVPIDLPAGVQDWINRLKEAWQNGEWEQVGEIIAEGLNKAMSVVDDWFNNTLRPLGTKWAGRFAEILNGIVKGLNWELLGKTLADGLNAVADIINTFFEKFKAKEFGAGLGRTIKSWFDNVEWDLIGKTFANKWNMLLHIIEGIVTTPGIWKSIGTSIGQFVKSWFETIDINSLATILINAVNGVVEMVGAFLDQKPFERLAAKITSAINRVLHEVDWAGLGKTVGRLFTEMLHALYDAIKNIDWEQVGRAIGQFLKGIDWKAVFIELAHVIWEAVKAALKTLAGLLKELGPEIIMAGILAVIAIIAGKIALTTLFAPIIASLGTALAGIVGTVVTAIAGWPALIIAALAAALAILIIWLKNGGAETVHGFLQGIQEAWFEIVEYFSAAFTALQEQLQLAWESITLAARLAWTALRDTVVQLITSAKEAVVTAVTTIQAKMKESWEAIKNNAATNMRLIANETKQRFTEMRNTIEQLMTAAKNTLVSLVQNMYNSAKSSWNALLAACKSIFNSVYSTIVELISRATSFISGTSWYSLGVNLMQGFLNGLRSLMSTIWSEVQAFVQRCVEAIRNALNIHSPSKVTEELGEYTGLGFLNGIKNEQADAVKTARNLADAVTNEMAGGIGDVETNMTGLASIVDGLRDLADAFKVIADMLSISDGFKMPEIAAGTIAPAKTRAAALAAPTDDSGGSTAYLSEILSTLQTLAGLIQSARGEGGSVIKLIIDGREILNAVVDENNREITRTGASPIRV